MIESQIFISLFPVKPMNSKKHDGLSWNPRQADSESYLPEPLGRRLGGGDRERKILACGFFCTHDSAFHDYLGRGPY